MEQFVRIVRSKTLRSKQFHPGSHRSGPFFIDLRVARPEFRGYVWMRRAVRRNRRCHGGAQFFAGAQRRASNF